MKLVKMSGSTLVTARQRLGLNQTKAAKRCDVGLWTICQAEKGRGVYPSTAKKICKGLALDVEMAILPFQEEGGDAA